MNREEVAPWPTNEEGVTVEAIRKSLLCLALVNHKRIMGNILGERGLPKHETLLSIAAISESYNIQFLLGQMEAIDPEKALGAARGYWWRCELSDGYGEQVWEELAALGIDPETISLPNEPGPPAQNGDLRCSSCGHPHIAGGDGEDCGCRYCDCTRWTGPAPPAP